MNDEIKNNKTFKKESGKKIWNQKNKDQFENNNPWQIVIQWWNWKHQKLFQKGQWLK